MTRLPGDVLAQMRMGTEYRVPIRVRGFSVMVRPLSIAEENEVISQVLEEMRKMPESARNPQTEHTLLAKKYLCLASTTAPNAYDFQITNDMVEAMTVNEVQALYKQYVGVTEKANPMLEEMPEKEILDLVEKVKKKSSDATELSFMELVNVCLHLLGDRHTDS